MNEENINEEKQPETTTNTENPKPKKSGKAKKFIIAVVAVIIIAAIVIGILFATGILNINLSKKSKMVAGVEKIGERLSSTMEDLSGDSKDSNSTIKILKNINKDSAIDFSGEISANIDTFELSDDVASVDESAVKTILNLINSSKLGMNYKYDGKEKLAASVNGKVDNVELSGEVVYDGDQVALRSEEISEKWLSISKEDIKEMLKEQGVEFEEIQEMISKMTEQMMEVSKSLEIDEKTQKEIEERYAKVLKDFINEKSKDIESEKDKVTVDGKSKNCEKLTLKLNGNDVKDLLIAYVDAFKSDKKTQEIINKSFKSYIDAINEMSTTLPENDGKKVEVENILDDLLNNIDEIKDEIKDLDLDATFILTVYATNTDVYRTDISIISNKVEVLLEMTFNKEDTVIDLSMKSAGMKLDIATITIKSEKESASIKFETADGIEEYLGQKMVFEISCKNSENKTELSILADLGKNGKGSISIVSNINKNEDNEYAAEITLNIDLDINNVITTKGNLKISTSTKVGNVSIPEVKDAIDSNNQAAVEAYMLEAQENITKIMEEVSKIDGLSELINTVEKPESPNMPEVPELPELPDIDF